MTVSMPEGTPPEEGRYANGQPLKPRSWEEKIRATQAAIRAAWIGAAEQLGQSAASNNQLFDRRIKFFVAAMPKIDTKRTSPHAHGATWTAPR